MDCNNLHKLIPDFTEGKLPGNLNQEVEKHLDLCSGCSILYEKYIKTIHLLKPVNEIPEQPFYYTNLRQRMENKFNKHTSIKKILQPLIYLASLIVAVYIGILIGSNGGVAPGQYSEKNNESKDYIQRFAEYQYLNDFEIEPIENLFVKDSLAEEK